MDKIAIVIVLTIVVVAAGFLVWQSGNLNKASVAPALLPQGIVLFYSPNCPHCQDVEAFLTANNIAQKVKYTQLEVPFGAKTSPQLQANAALAIQLAQQCKMDVSSGLSIPFLYDGNGKCYLGEVDVPNFFKAQAGIK